MSAADTSDGEGRLRLEISTRARPDFEGALVAYAFDRRGELLDRAEVTSGKTSLAIPEREAARARVFIAPADERVELAEPTPSDMRRLGAYEAILRPGAGAGLAGRIEIPGEILDRWPLCFCRVRGRVVRAGDHRAVCDARVRICEVDRLPRWILRLPDPDLLRLRDDLLDVLRNPPIPRPPDPIPDPEPGPFPPGPRPGPDPAPLARPLFRFGDPAEGGSRAAPTPRPAPGSRVLDPASALGFNPQPEPPGSRFLDPASIVGFNPQPEPPGREAMARSLEIDPALRARLHSPSIPVVRRALVEHWELLVPWFCLWPWWWWRFRCDEVAVVTTDAYGRFEALIWYPCGGDRPDLYFSVEYDLGSGLETVHHPPIACHTHWDYECGEEVTIPVSDPRLPACEGEPDLPGCQVVVASIGVGVAVREIRTDAVGPAQEGLTTAAQPFGGTLEPRVDFSRTCLIETKKIPYYRWSYRRLSGPDGVTADVGSWTILTRDVWRHYKEGTSYPSDFMGPMPTSGPPPVAPIPNLFRIRPVDPPAGEEWIVLNEHVDLATAYFETASLPGAPTSGPSGGTPAPDDLAAGRYELKLELFDEDGNLVNWTDEGIDLRITEQDAPFGTGTITTEPAPPYNRILDGSGDTLGFRMVLRVDNNRCYAEIHPVGGDVTPDPACGFHEYAAPTDDVRLSFVARHPNGFATYGFTTRRAAGTPIGAASTSGTAGAPGTAGFVHLGGFAYEKDVAADALLGSCDRAAFAERLDVHPRATNGYTTLSGYRHADTAAFALAAPCPSCECDAEEEDDD